MSEAKELRAKAEFWVRLCALPRYSFIVKNNGLARIEDRVGSWVELHEVMKIVDAAQEKIDELTAELNCRAQPAAQAVPEGLLDRIEAAIKRIEDGHCSRRIPADPTDVDLVLAECRALLEGRWPPFWIDAAAPTPPAGEVES